MSTRLTLKDPTLFPIQAFFNSISDSDFVYTVDRLTSGIGICNNDACCIFPTGLDPGEETFDGVCFSLFEDRIIISEDELRKYLAIVCRQHIAAHPADEDALNELLRRPLHQK